MFPTDDNNFIGDTASAVAVSSPEIKNNLKFNFIEKKFEVVDGRVVKVNDIPAIKQWMEKFIRTSLDATLIYVGQKFGTTIKNIIGYKSLNNGFSESEAEREISEGFLLNPAIAKVTYVDISKNDGVLVIATGVLLVDGTNLEERFNV
jgi:hypothetical protein